MGDGKIGKGGRERADVEASIISPINGLKSERGENGIKKKKQEWES